MNNELTYYSFQDILKFIDIDYQFRKDHKEYPFNRGEENVTFGWGQILIPEYGIKAMVENKISDNEDEPINKIKMMYQIPFVENGTNHSGIINQNIELEWRYDKTWKYGDITSSIYEVCYWILMHSVRTNDFYIINGDMVHEFFSYCIIPNQWGQGRMLPVSSPCEMFGEVRYREEGDIDDIG